ncbi:GDYXXLXY domain-containing protein [Brevibacillus nitrificans]|uniref:GDYXXLXY domain-containing protein n=1 Tax=Brevibacillus nitrificans TaxID=651560 RepID=UPI002E1B9C91|nr:GDYXXLXY domain-containing protein [Brevibacillus nitrificans]
MQQNAVRLGYFLAISLLLSALFYFFASNWPVLSRWEKIGVSTSVLVLFYLFSYVATLVLKRHTFLSNWLLVAGGLAFGISAALLGQIYNSHADSYMLFVVWLIPNLLFAIVSRYQPFYVISYVLAHLALCFFLQPSVIHVVRDGQWWFMVFWLIALGNLLLFWLTASERLKSRPLYYLSFLAFQLALFSSSFVEVYGGLPELLYLVIGGALFFGFLKWMPNRVLLIVTSTMLALFLLAQFFWFMFEHYSESFFLIGLLAAVGIVWGAVAAMKWLKRQAASHDSRWVRFFQEAFTVLVTLVAATIGAVSLAGFLFLVIGDDDTVIYFLFFLSLIGLLVPVFSENKMNGTVRYTLMTMGCMIGVATSLYLDGYYWVALLAGLCVAWTITGGIPTKLLTQFVFLFILYFKLGDWRNTHDLVLAIIFVSQMAMYLLPSLPNALRNSSLGYGLLSLLVLTESNQWGGAWNVAISLVYFVITTYLVYRTMHRKDRVSFAIALGFWFAFLLMKYYDLLWSLLHKSISLLLLSIVFFAISYWFDRSVKSEWEAAKPALFAQKRFAFLLIILLQLVLIGYQIASSETILTQGRAIKLKLEPIDPRSLLQGDYVRLGYTISTLEQENISDMESKIQVVLRPQADGVYDYSGYYEQNGVWNRAYQMQPDDVMINGNVIGSSQVEYGIESYFVPEGTGLEVERSAKFAQVRVSKKGDAILESLSAQ